MGKAQSKRSVDITTETKKGTEDEVTEKMGKIEDLDKKEGVNGDATISEKSDQEKKDVEVVENDKDMTTEKDVDVQASGDSADAQNTAETSKEEGGSAPAEEISPLSDESIKKSKKEKVKKKWSFRSISFGKKDKQKPAKSEEAAEEGSSAVNGADDEEKKNESDEAQKDKSANGTEEKATTESLENGNATPQEIKQEQTNGEKLPEDKSNDKTANTTNIATTTETREPVQNETAAVSSELSEKTENTANINNETKKTSENSTTTATTTTNVDDASKNGNGLDQESQQQKTVEKNATAEVSSDKTSSPSLAKATINNDSLATAVATTNGEVVDQIHQNGDHGESEQTKAQIEVNTNTVDNNVSAATLDILSSSTSINPSKSNVQTHVQDLKASSSEENEEILVQINNVTTTVIEKSTTDTTTITDIDDQSIVSNAVVEVAPQVKEVVFDAAPSNTLENENSLQENMSVDLSPPPLPISPPPSQVSVFAFTNNEEESIETKNFVPALNNLISIEELKTEISLPIIEIDNNSKKISDTLEQQNLQLPDDHKDQVNVNNEEIQIDHETEVNNYVDKNQSNDHEAEVNTQVDQIENDEHEVEVDKIETDDHENKVNTHLEEIQCRENKVEDEDEKKEEAILSKDLAANDNAVHLLSVVSEQAQTDEDTSSVALATKVINEITETAAEIVNNQLLNCQKEQIINDLVSSQDQVNKENIIEPNSRDNDNDITNSDNNVQDDQHNQVNLICEEEHVPKISLDRLLENIEQTTTTNNKTIEECSIDFTETETTTSTTTNLVHPNEEEMNTNSINKSNNLDDEMHFDPTKEFATAKEIKDNVTVAEITQDLSVTCE